MRNLLELQDEITQFCKDRDWDQFHTNKDLAIGLVTEASELLQLLRFQTDGQCHAIAQSQAFKDELGDVLFFLLRIAERNGLDLVQCGVEKLAKTSRKYPISLAKGSNTKL